METNLLDCLFCRKKLSCFEKSLGDKNVISFLCKYFDIDVSDFKTGEIISGPSSSKSSSPEAPTLAFPTCVDCYDEFCVKLESIYFLLQDIKGQLSTVLQQIKNKVILSSDGAKGSSAPLNLNNTELLRSQITRNAISIIDSLINSKRPRKNLKTKKINRNSSYLNTKTNKSKLEEEDPWSEIPNNDASINLNCEINIKTEKVKSGIQLETIKLEPEEDIETENDWQQWNLNDDNEGFPENDLNYLAIEPDKPKSRTSRPRNKHFISKGLIVPDNLQSSFVSESETETEGSEEDYRDETWYDKEKESTKTSVKCRKRKKIERNEEKPKLVLNKSKLKVSDLTCNVCGKISQNEKALQRHKYGSHGEEKKITKCEICPNMTLVYPNSIIRHMIDHEKKGDKIYQCLECSKEFVTRYMLERHITAHTFEDARPYYCEMCEHRFETELDLESHNTLTHEPKKPKITCTSPGCERNFNSKIRRLMHEYQCHYPILFEFACTKCNKRYAEETYLQTHLTTHGDPEESGPFQCFVCSISFPTKEFLSQHLPKHTGEPNLKCSHCSESFMGKDHLRAHEKRVHGTQGQLVCEHCGARFFEKSHLKSHSAVHLNEKKFHCKVCGNNYKTQNQLRFHTRSVHEATHRTCELCGANVKNIQVHKKIVHGGAEVRKHECPYCKKKFKMSAELKIHIRIHTGVKPFVCHICLKAFIQKHCLKSHFEEHVKAGTFKPNSDENLK